MSRVPLQRKKTIEFVELDTLFPKLPLSSGTSASIVESDTELLDTPRRDYRGPCRLIMIGPCSSGKSSIIGTFSGIPHDLSHYHPTQESEERTHEFQNMGKILNPPPSNTILGNHVHKKSIACIRAAIGIREKTRAEPQMKSVHKKKQPIEQGREKSSVKKTFWKKKTPNTKNGNTHDNANKKKSARANNACTHDNTNDGEIDSENQNGLSLRAITVDTAGHDLFMINTINTALTHHTIILVINFAQSSFQNLEKQLRTWLDCIHGRPTATPESSLFKKDLSVKRSPIALESCPEVYVFFHKIDLVMNVDHKQHHHALVSILRTYSLVQEAFYTTCEDPTTLQKILQLIVLYTLCKKSFYDPQKLQSIFRRENIAKNTSTTTTTPPKKSNNAKSTQTVVSLPPPSSPPSELPLDPLPPLHTTPRSSHSMWKKLLQSIRNFFSNSI